EERVVQAHGPLAGFGVGIEQVLVRVEAMAGSGIVRPVHAIAVAQSRAGLRQVAMPHLDVALLELDPHRLPPLVAVVEEAQLDPGGVLREQRKVDAGAVPGGPQWMGGPRPDPHAEARRTTRPPAAAPRVAATRCGEPASAHP